MNRWLDRLPRAEFFRAAHPVPVYRACGVAGFYLAVIVTFGAALATGRSVVIAAVLAAVCAASFFLYTALRRWVAGRECLVLMEHVWFALACTAGVLFLMREPLLAWLDAIAPGLCLFLAAGRCGCLLVGCCHGVPSSIGIVYPRELVAEGFRSHWVGVRLFPVQAVELLGLIGIGLTGLLALGRVPEGSVLAWFLLSYAVMRFGLEGLRGDRRPEWLGLSQPRWMALAEVAAVCVWSGPDRPAALALLAVVLLLSLFVWDYRRPARRLLSAEHCGEIRALLDQAVLSVEPQGFTTRAGATIAVSTVGSHTLHAHVSLALPAGSRDVALLAQLCAMALPEVDPEDCVWIRGLLHFPLALPVGTVPKTSRSGAAIHGAVARKLQQPPPVPARPKGARSGTGWYFKVGSP